MQFVLAFQLEELQEELGVIEQPSLSSDETIEKIEGQRKERGRHSLEVTKRRILHRSEEEKIVYQRKQHKMVEAAHDAPEMVKSQLLRWKKGDRRDGMARVEAGETVRALEAAIEL
jgi:hypothetical protein